jgi:hypothetical protein
VIRTSFRLPTDVIERLDALAPSFSSRAAKATRADVLRILITDALKIVEAAARENPGAVFTGIKATATTQPKPKRSR